MCSGSYNQRNVLDQPFQSKLAATITTNMRKAWKIGLHDKRWKASGKEREK